METPAPKPSRIKRFFRRALFVLAALITLGALLIAEENWRGSRAWRNYKRTMEAKGERFDAARLIPPEVPDAENLAACPYLAHVFEKPPESPGWTNIDSYMPAFYTLPQRTNWPYGLAADLSTWVAAFQKTNTVVFRHTPMEQMLNRRVAPFQGTNTSEPKVEKMEPAQAAAIILDHLKGAEPILAELRAASLRPRCRFNIPYEDWVSGISHAGELTVHHLAVFKGLFQVLALHAAAELAASRSDQALEDVHLMFRLEEGLKEEPILMSQLVRYTSTAILLKPIAEGLAERRWSDAQLRALEEQLGQTDLLGSTVQALYGERDIIVNPFFSSGIMKLLGWGRLEQINVNRAFQEVLLPRINLAAREINPAVGHACDLAMSNYTQGGRVTRFIHHRIMAALLTPTVFPTVRHAAVAQTEVDLLTVACALERYRLAQGAYPDQLEALAPRFIASLPHDIINGQPLKYRRAANGKFVLYSVGWNGKDDGGVTATKKDGSPDRQQGDWVLAYPD
jgi:hypothetical protein